MKVLQAAALCPEYQKSNSRENIIRAHEGKVPSNKWIHSYPKLNYEKARTLFREHGGMLKASVAICEGIHPRALYEMRDKGIVEVLSRGLYRLADRRPLSNQDLVTVALRIPNRVVCLISALAFHGITTQVPHEVCIAVERFKGILPKEVGRVRITPIADLSPLSIE
jgi:hypothetical protein